MEKSGTIRDLIYFDFDKAASLVSQVEGGLLREIRSGFETTKTKRNNWKMDFKVIKSGFGGTASEQTSQLESRVLHHDLLVRIEEALFELGVAIDLNSKFGECISEPEQVRSELSRVSYLRTEGWAVIEDFERIKRIAGDFNSLIAFINKCSIQAIQDTKEFKEMEHQLRDLKDQVNAKKDRNERAKRQSQVKEVEAKIQGIAQQAATTDELQGWLLEGIGSFIDTFMAGRINLRVYPFESSPGFQVIANLKRDCFVDSDLDNLLFAYSTRPNIKLSVLGLITSLPARYGQHFDPMKEFDLKNDRSTDEERFEKGFRGLFSAMEGLESFVRFSRYPGVTVYPLAVYRMIQTEPSQRLTSISSSAENEPRKVNPVRKLINRLFSH